MSNSAAIRPFHYEASKGRACRSEEARRGDQMARPRTGLRTTRKACSSRRCRSSRTIGRRSTTGANARRSSTPLPNFITEIDGLDIHFIHVRSKHENALPMIVTHGWPGSIIEQMKIIEPLTNPTAHGGSAADAFHRRDPVAAGLRLLRQADGAGLESRHASRRAWATLMQRLGYTRIRGAGRRLGQCRLRGDGAAAAAGIARHPHQHGGHRSARYLEGACRRRPAACRTLAGRNAAPGTSSIDFYKNGPGLRASR